MPNWKGGLVVMKEICHWNMDVEILICKQWNFMWIKALSIPFVGFFGNQMDWL